MAAKIKAGKAPKPEVKRDFPRRYLRVVLQLEDTPENRLIAERSVVAVKHVFGKPEGFGAILKYEQVFMCSAEVPNPNS